MVPVAEQVLARQDQLERRICQDTCSGRGSRGILGTGCSRPTEERKDGDGDAPPGDHHERFPDLERLRPLVFCETCSGNHRVSIFPFTSSKLAASLFAKLTSCAKLAVKFHHDGVIDDQADRENKTEERQSAASKSRAG